MKIIITENQYKKLLNEVLPTEVDTEIGDKVNKFVIGVFKWCHENVNTKSRFPKDVKIDVKNHPILLLRDGIGKTFLLTDRDSLMLSYNFYIRYDNTGDYEQFLNEDLIYFGEFYYHGEFQVKQELLGTAMGSVWSFGRSPKDVLNDIERGFYYKSEIDDSDDVEVDDFHPGYGYNHWEMIIPNNPNINDIEYL